jgi:hypothetical protein
LLQNSFQIMIFVYQKLQTFLIKKNILIITQTKLDWYNKKDEYRFGELDARCHLTDVSWHRADPDAFGSSEVNRSNQHTTAHPKNQVTFSVHYNTAMEWCNTGSRYVRVKLAGYQIQILQSSLHKKQITQNTPSYFSWIILNT